MQAGLRPPRLGPLGFQQRKIRLRSSTTAIMNTKCVEIVLKLLEKETNSETSLTLYPCCLLQCQIGVYKSQLRNSTCGNLTKTNGNVKAAELVFCNYGTITKFKITS